MITAEDVIRALQAYLYKELVDTYDERVVLACLDELFVCLYINFKGQLMYVPTSDKLQISTLHAAIYKDFTGSNHRELSVKYRRSLPNIYNIVKHYRTEEMRKLQVDIFPLQEKPIPKPITRMVIEDYLPHGFKKIGLSDQDANNFSTKLSRFLCQNYPGISICISDTLRKNWINKGQLSLF